MKIACFSFEQHYRQNHNGVDVVIGAGAAAAAVDGAAAVVIVVAVIAVAMSFDGVSFFGVFTPSKHLEHVLACIYELFRLHDTASQ